MKLFSYAKERERLYACITFRVTIRDYWFAGIRRPERLHLNQVWIQRGLRKGSRAETGIWTGRIV